LESPLARARDPVLSSLEVDCARDGRKTESGKKNSNAEKEKGGATFEGKEGKSTEKNFSL